MTESRKFFEDIPITDQSLDDSYEEVLACRRLWRAVLDQMVEDLCGEDGPSKKEAQFWFTGGTMYNAISPGFDDVCDLAGLDVEWVRERISAVITSNN